MAEILAPRDAADLVEIVAAARADRRRLAVRGAGTRAALGRPTVTDAVVSLERLAGITLYEPAELVMTAGAGTPLSVIRAALADQGQELAFDPIEHALLFAHPAGTTTIGGAIGVGASGPRRPKLGAVRDHLLGFRAVNGLGQAFKSGGRVMKNVTGFDLSKLVCGAFGTLAILTEATFKVLPRPETEETIAVLGLDPAQGCALLREAAGSPQEVAALAHLPARPEGPFPGTSATLVRLDGPPVSVAGREADLLHRWRGRGDVEILGEDESRTLWDDLREAGPVARRPGTVWRLSLAPGDCPPLLAGLQASHLPVDTWFADWAGGLLWIALADETEVYADIIRSELGRFGGHALLVRAPSEIRAREPVFEPQPPTLAALTERVRSAFDPDRLFEPGRRVEEA